jgi:hypothetical protein
MSSRGLWVANAKIDPKFSNDDFEQALEVTVMNATEKKITIKRGDPFCSIYFGSLVGEVDGKCRKVKVDTLPDEEMGRLELLWYHYGASPNYVWLSVATVLASLFIYLDAHRPTGTSTQNTTNSSGSISNQNMASPPATQTTSNLFPKTH